MPGVEYGVELGVWRIAARLFWHYTLIAYLVLNNGHTMQTQRKGTPAMLYNQDDNTADFEAEMAAERETVFWTAEQWAEFEFMQDIESDISAEKRADAKMAGGYGWS